MADHFTYRVSWSEEDGEHVGTCLEFPSLSHLADDPEAALRGIRGLVADVVSDLRANNEPVPQPLAETRYSGKFMTRIPPELHRQLAIEAAQENVSLNRLVSMRLTGPKFIEIGLSSDPKKGWHGTSIARGKPMMEAHVKVGMRKAAASKGSCGRRGSAAEA